MQASSHSKVGNFYITLEIYKQICWFYISVHYMLHFMQVAQGLKYRQNSRHLKNIPVHRLGVNKI